MRLAIVVGLSASVAWGAFEGAYDPSGNFSSARSTTNTAPVLLLSPADQIVAPGELASFSPLLKNPLGCGYQWRWFGTNLLGRTQETLLLTNVSAADQGPYTVVITNGFGAVTSEVARLYIDADRDSLPDTWEESFGLVNQRGAMDTDGDGVSNLDEYYDGTNPTNKASFRPRLSVRASGGTVVANPAQGSYGLGDLVSLQANPTPPNLFEGWIGDITGTQNPASLVMSTNRVVRGLFECFAAEWGIAAWWRGELNANDFVGTNHGAFYSGSTAVDGTFNPSSLSGAAFSFYGTNYIRVPDAPALRPAQLTLEAWVNPSVQNANYQTVIARGAISGDDDAYYLGVNNGVAFFWSKHTTGMQLVNGGSVPVNRWTHLVGTFDGAAKSLYVNGLRVGFQNMTSPLLYDTGSIPVTIGADWVNNGPAYPFNGLVDEATVFNRALSAIEVNLLFNDSAAGKCRTRPILTSAPTLSDARQGTPYSFQVQSGLGTAPVSYAVGSGSLPAGLSMSTGGLISGTPTIAGSSAFSVLAVDSSGSSAEQFCTLRVVPAGVASMPAGLIAWWRFEGNALDSLGTNHGTLRNGAGFDSGRVGTALALDGVDDSVEIADSVTLRPNALSAECWVLFTNAAGVQVLFSKPAGTSFLNTMALWLNTGDLRGSVGNLFNGGEVLSYPFGPVTNRWYHIAYVYDPLTRSQRLYVDGRQVATGAASVGMVYDGNPWLLGRDSESGVPSYFLKGRMDEASLYNRPLSAEEVQSIFDSGSAGKKADGPYINTAAALPDGVVGAGYSQQLAAARGATPVTFSVKSGSLPAGLLLGATGAITGEPLSAGTNLFTVRATDSLGAFSEKEFTLTVYAATPPPAGIVGWWRAEGNGLDSIGTNHGVLQNGAGFTDGRVGQAFMFNGANQSLAIADGPAFRSASFSVETWVSLSTVLGTQVIIAKPLGNGPLDSYTLYLENGTLRGILSDTNGFLPVMQTPWNPVAGRWYHVALTFDEASRRQTLYLDGTAMAAGGVDRVPQFDSNPLLLGRDSENGTPAYFLSGRVDEAAAYNRALTDAEIHSLWEAGAAGRSATGPYFVNAPALPEGMVGLGYSQTISAARETLPVTYSVVGGALPAGLSLTTAGNLTGVPLLAGSYGFDVRAADAAALRVEGHFTLNISANAAPPAGIISWWRAETNTLDAIGNNHGIPVNGISYGLGRVGRAFVLDGVNDGVVVADSASLHPSSLTIEAWVQFNIAGGMRTIISKPLGNGTLNSFLLVHNSSANRLSGSIADINGVGPEVTAPLTPAIGAWYHVAFTFDEQTRQQALYVDGEPAGYAAGNRAIGYDNSPVHIGRDVDNGSVTAVFSGRIDEPAIYNRALNPVEISKLYHASSLGKLTLGPYFTTAPGLPAGVVLKPYVANLSAARASGTAAFSLVGGTLPPGIALSPTGTLSGTPTSPGRYAFEVQVSDNSGVVGRTTMMIEVNAPVAPPSGIVSWWRGEGNGTDSMGTSHGVLMNGLLFAEGVVGSSFSMDGTDTSLDVPDSASLRSPSFTVETWVMFQSTTSLRHIFAKPIGNGTLDSIAVWYESGQLRAAVADAVSFGTILSIPFTPVPGRWYHVAYAFDQEEFQQVLYLDGLEVAAGMASKPVAYEASPLLLGRDQDYGAAVWFLNGRIDEAAFYNRALEGPEIYSLYKAGAAGKSLTGPYFITQPRLPASLVNVPYSQLISVARASAPMTFQVVSGSLPAGVVLSPGGALSGAASSPGKFSWRVVATNSMGESLAQNFSLQVYAPVPLPASLAAWWKGENNGLDSIGTNNGVLSNNVTFAAGRVGNAFNLDGAGANVQVPDSAGFFSRTTPFSIEAWVKAWPQQPNGDGLFLIVDKSHGYADGTGWGLQGNANGTVSFFIGKGGSSAGSSFVGTNTQASVLDYRWHHIAGVYDGAMVSVYMDGMLHGVQPMTNAPAGNNRNLSIGRSWGGGNPTRYFRGMIDEVSFYTNALSAVEIAGLYAAGAAGKTSEVQMPPLVMTATWNSGVLTIGFGATAGKTYYLQYKENLSDAVWLDLSSVTAQSNNVEVPVTPGTGSRFYRVYTNSN